MGRSGLGQCFRGTPQLPPPLVGEGPGGGGVSICASFHPRPNPLRRWKGSSAGDISIESAPSAWWSSANSYQNKSDWMFRYPVALLLTPIMEAWNRQVSGAVERVLIHLRRSSR